VTRGARSVCRLRRRAPAPPREGDGPPPREGDGLPPREGDGLPPREGDGLPPREGDGLPPREGERLHADVGSTSEPRGGPEVIAEKGRYPPSPGSPIESSCG